MKPRITRISRIKIQNHKINMRKLKVKILKFLICVNLCNLWLHFFLVYTGEAFEQKKASGGFPGEYLTSFTASARAAGMGDAFAAVSGDGAIVYWNPAGLIDTSANALSLVDSELFYEDRYNFFQYLHPFSWQHAFSIAYLNLISAKAEGRTLLGDETGNFQDSQRAILISYAYKFPASREFALGTNVKIVSQDLAGYSAKGYGLDLGLLMGKKLKLGICLQNLIPPKLRLIDYPDAFPANLRAGISYELLHNKLILASDLSLVNLYDWKSPHPFRWYAGMECSFLKVFGFRAGINYKAVSAGLGISLRKFSFDYAASFHNLGVIHHFSLRFRFGLLPAVEEQELARKKEAFNKEKQEWEQKKLAVEKLCAIAEKINQRDYETAKILAERLLTAEPENPEAKKLLAIAKQEAEKTVLERTLNLALKHFKEEKYEQANKEFIRVLDLDPAQPVAAELKHLTQAYVYIKQEKYVEANKEIIATLKINPDNQKAKNLQRRLQTVLGIVGSEGNK